MVFAIMMAAFNSAEIITNIGESYEWKNRVPQFRLSWQNYL